MLQMGYKMWQAYEIWKINFVTSKKLWVMFEMFLSVTADKYDPVGEV